MAMVLPFLPMMFGVALDYCRVFYVSQTLQDCAWVGAMYASGTAVNPSAASPDAAARQAVAADATTLNPPLDSTMVVISYPGNTAVVTVQYQYRALTPLVGDWGTITITRTATMGMAPTGP